MAVSIEKCNELIKNKDNKIQTQENMLKNNINVFEEQIEVKWKENNKEITMVLSIDNDGKRKRIPQYTMAAQSVSPEYSAINSGNISPCFREANPNTIIADIIAK